ncbi:MAG: UDP-N-acetylmuramoyl-L-alanyl-D-glutamate--2,6-diaminopimelate ligase [Thermoguttaceae bacterium]
MRICPDSGQPVRLRPLLPDAKFFGAEDILVDRVSCDPRRIARGSLFVALREARHDGHAFIHQAVARGCSAILAERRVPGIALPMCVVPDSRAAYARLCQALAGDPSRQLKLIGITGTRGKTTTSCLIASILSGAGCRVGLVGSLGCCDGRTVTPTSETTPPAHVLAVLLARMVRNGCSHAVLEVSSQALDQCRLSGILLDAACLTNVRRDHLDYHRTLRNYRLAKSKIFQHLSEVGFAVLNADDPVAMGLLGQIDGPVLTVGMNPGAEITATPLERMASEQTILLCAGNEIIPVRTRMIGIHHVYNCLVAAAVGLAYGIDLPTVVRGLEAVDHVPGRLERIDCGQPFSVFVDSADTPDGLASSLATLREVTQGRLLCVVGAGNQPDQGKRPLLGRAAEVGADLVVITNDGLQAEHPLSVLQDILSGMRRPGDVELIPDRAEAIAWALSQAQAGDCVLIASKTHKAQQMAAARRLAPDDRELARQWLYDNQETVASKQ